MIKYLLYDSHSDIFPILQPPIHSHLTIYIIQLYKNVRYKYNLSYKTKNHFSVLQNYSSTTSEVYYLMLFYFPMHYLLYKLFMLIKIGGFYCILQHVHY